MNTKLKILKNAGVVAAIIAVIAFSSCEKYVWDPPKFIPPDTTKPFDTVFYSTDVAPLFPSYNCTGCHSGGINPDLRVNNSYAALTNPANSYVNVQDPLTSRLIVQIKEPHGGGMSADDINTLLNWISQGAKDY